MSQHTMPKHIPVRVNLVNILWTHRTIEVSNKVTHSLALFDVLTKSFLWMKVMVVAHAKKLETNC